MHANEVKVEINNEYWSQARETFIGLGFDAEVAVADQALLQNYPDTDEGLQTLTANFRAPLAEIDAHMTEAVEKSAIQKIYRASNDDFGLAAAWAASNAGVWLGSSWHFLGSPSAPRDRRIKELRKGVRDPWFINIEASSYSPEIAPLATPFLTRLEEMIAASDNDWAQYRADKNQGQSYFPHDTVPNGGDLSKSRTIKLACQMLTGALALVVEYGEAPAERQADIAAMLVDGTKQLYSTSHKLIGAAIIEHPRVEILSPTIPTIAGFTTTQAALLAKSLEWLSANLQPVIPWRPITISPYADSAANGHVFWWSGDMGIPPELVLEDKFPALTGTLAHELMHAKPDLWGRLKQVRDDIAHTDEHEFLRMAALAVGAMVRGSGQAERVVSFDASNGEPVLAREDGSGAIRLPEESAVREAFLAEYVWRRMNGG